MQSSWRPPTERLTSRELQAWMYDAPQALCSALAKMCVRELRTEAPNTSVFYMAAVSLVAAVIGCFLPLAWGDTTSFKVPDHWLQWVLLCGVGASRQPPLSAPAQARISQSSRSAGWQALDKHHQRLEGPSDVCSCSGFHLVSLHGCIFLH